MLDAVLQYCSSQFRCFLFISALRGQSAAFHARDISRKSCLQLLQNNHSCGGRIELKDEAEFDFLGFSLDHVNGPVHYSRKLVSS